MATPAAESLVLLILKWIVISIPGIGFAWAVVKSWFGIKNRLYNLEREQEEMKSDIKEAVDKLIDKFDEHNKEERDSRERREQKYVELLEVVTVVKTKVENLEKR